MDIEKIETILTSIQNMTVGWKNQTEFDIAIWDCLTHIKRIKEVKDSPPITSASQL
jgi:hypothetical protein